MATQNHSDHITAADEAATLARLTADTINAAAYGENGTGSAQPWVYLHSRTVHHLCDHIDQLMDMLKRGCHGA